MDKIMGIGIPVFSHLCFVSGMQHILYVTWTDRSG